MHRRSVLAVAGAAIGLGALAPNAGASFGPGGASATSPAPIQDYSLEKWLGSTKSSERAGALSIQGAKKVSDLLEKQLAKLDSDWGNLDSLISELGEMSQSEEVQDKLKLLYDERERGRTARALKQKLDERARLLERLDQQPSWVVYGAAIFASFGSTLIVHPIDTIKTLTMSKADGGAGEGGGNDEGTEEQAGGGPMGFPPLGMLYKGLAPNLLKEGPPSGLYLGIYEAVKAALLPSSGLPPLVCYLIAGAAGEFAGSAVRAPSEAAKTRVQSGIASGPVEAFQQLAAEPGATFDTWSTSLARDVPFGGIQIALFEGVKTAILQNPNLDIDVNSLLAEALIGAFAGAVGAFVTCPADVVITRLITQSSSSADGENTGEGELLTRTSPADMARSIYEEGGLPAFFNGVGGRVGYWTPAIAIFLSLYCRLRSLGLEYF